MPAAESEQSEDEAKDSVSACLSRIVTERVTILTVSAKWYRSVSSCTSSERPIWNSVEESFHAVTSVRCVSVNVFLVAQLPDDDAIRKQATRRRSVDCRLESDLVLTDNFDFIS